jgi:hypothetical protein
MRTRAALLTPEAEPDRHAAPWCFAGRDTHPRRLASLVLVSATAIRSRCSDSRRFASSGRQEPDAAGRYELPSRARDPPPGLRVVAAQATF